MIYIPDAINVNQFEGCWWRDNFTIRCQETERNYNNTTYVDIYTDNHYVYQAGKSYYQDNINYIDNSLFTNDIYYRNDITSILICVFIILLVCFYFPFKLFMRLFKKGSVF